MNDLVEYKDHSVIVMDNIPPFCEEEYDLFDKTDFKKYVQDGENLIRRSFEYRRFISYLRNYMDMNKCSFFENISNEETFKIKIEIHHHPFTLYEIFLTVYNKRMFMKEPLDVELVAEEVMFIHYSLMVGLIPLAETVHQLVHQQLIFIPLDKVMGNYEYFVSMYSQFIPEESKHKLEELKHQTEIYSEAANMAILEQKPIYIKLPDDGSYKIPTIENMESLIDSMFNRIKQIKEENNYMLPDNNMKNQYYYEDNRYDNNDSIFYHDNDTNILYHI